MSCTKVISRGKNKGKRCCDVSNFCPHQLIKCENCNEMISKKNRTRHQAGCKPRKHLKIMKAVETKIIEEIHEIKDSVGKVEKLIRERPPSLNVYIGDNIYDDLVKKMGKKDAVDFLVRAASDNNPLSVIDKLYLDGNNKEDWPLAFKDGEFKYISKGKEMIIDKTGDKIGKLFGNVHNAMIQAVSEIIDSNLRGTAEDIKGMYDTYNMLKIQRNLYKLCGRTEILCNKLQSKVANPIHPFFQQYFIKLFFDDDNMLLDCELDNSTPM
jgi:hypothetical protein